MDHTPLESLHRAFRATQSDFEVYILLFVGHADFDIDTELCCLKI